ncbi:MAG TPA: hypothetical protein VM781_00090 [Candidatus Bathyarchaeia archaeon]|nr:hypothetical protein [Candidatus Bathyarchaeia archaeon]
MSIRENRFPLIALATAGLLLFVWSGAANAQSQSDSAPSVAEAARRAREQKKESGKPVRTLTNDDLPPAPAGDAARDTTANSDDAGAATPAVNQGGEKKAAAPANDEQAKRLKANNAAALERAKKQLAQFESELDIMQRKAALDSDSYYSKTDFASDTAGKASLDAEAQEIDAKKQDIEDLKARIVELQAMVGETTETQPDKDKTDPSDKTDQNPPSR